MQKPKRESQGSSSYVVSLILHNRNQRSFPILYNDVQSLQDIRFVGLGYPSFLTEFQSYFVPVSFQIVRPGSRFVHLFFTSFRTVSIVLFLCRFGLRLRSKTIRLTSLYPFLYWNCKHNMNYILGLFTLFFFRKRHPFPVTVSKWRLNRSLWYFTLCLLVREYILLLSHGSVMVHFTRTLVVPVFVVMRQIWHNSSFRSPKGRPLSEALGKWNENPTYYGRGNYWCFYFVNFIYLYNSSVIWK